MVEFQGAAGPTAGTGGTDGSDGGTAGEQALPPVCLGCGAELACATKGIPRGPRLRIRAPRGRVLEYMYVCIT
jgi:hypothetical protein